MNQAEVDRAALVILPELKRLIAIRNAGAWKLAVETGERGTPQLTTGPPAYVDGSTDSLGVRSQSEVRGSRVNPLGESVFWREGPLIEIVDALVEPPSPLHPRAPVSSWVLRRAAGCPGSEP